ncbi:hypothetical protein K5549_015697 [Capra hircus]|nr:hypothetical protein K5549_015697 [Capra hircus]
MPAPQCASCHTARAALRRPRSGQALCGACFCAAFEAEVLHTVLAGRLLPPGAVVAVGASGGKDSTVLAHVLRELAPRLGISLHLVAVDEGIGGYRDRGAGSCAAAGGALGPPAHRRGLRGPLRGLDDGTRWPAALLAPAAAAPAAPSAGCCGAALEEGARLVGATHVVTGHNADDMAETLASQKEVVLYAHFRRLDYFSEECVYAPEAFRGHARDLLKMLEAARPPSAVLDLVHSAERLALAPAARPPPPGACSRCGALASLALCQACALLGRPEPRPAPPGHRQGPPGAGRGGAAAGAAAVPTADF